MKYSASSVWENKDRYGIAVIGAGHAGCEAALAAARLGVRTIMFTVSVDSIALMPCNPNIGGSSKGHLVKEVDALGGEMGKVIDRTFIQSKMLNKSKGPAVHSLRAQADKARYSTEMRKVLEQQENLDIKQAEVTEILVENGKVTGVKTFSGAVYHCDAVVLCTGTYLKSRCIYGEVSENCGPNGLKAANYLSDCLKELGVQMYRFKTGTPARIDRNSIDFTKMVEQFGDERVVPFSFTTNPEEVQIDQVSCWLTYTNERTHEIIRENLDRSPLFSGMIEGTGPRYCPSIEDKVVKFADKDRHQVFIEPEGLTLMRCISEECPVRFRRMFSMKCIEVYRGWSMQRLSVMPMRSNMIVLMPDSFMRRWNLKRSAGCSVEDNLTEVLDMRRQQHKGLWRVLTQQGKCLEKSRSL